MREWQSLGRRLVRSFDTPPSGVARRIDLAHAARADGLDDLLFTEPGTKSKRHLVVGAKRFSSSVQCCTTTTFSD